MEELDFLDSKKLHAHSTTPLNRHRVREPRRIAATLAADENSNAIVGGLVVRVETEMKRTCAHGKKVSCQSVLDGMHPTT